jgi:hypothetical protein
MGMEEKFDKTKFIVNFESIFTNKKMNSAFYKFLESEHSNETLDFLTDVRNFEETKDLTQQIEQAKLIISTYLMKDSKKELNISGELREKTLAAYEPQSNTTDKWVLEIKPEKLFDECFHVMASVLRHDPFKRFIRTDECEKIMQIYQKHNSVITPVITNMFSYQMPDFQNPYIDDKDFDFFKALMEDNYNWKLYGSKVLEQMNTFITNTKYIDDEKISKTITVAKCETILNCSLDAALLGYFSNEMVKKDPNCARFQTMDFIEHEELVKIYKEQKRTDQISKYKRDLLISILDFALPFPLGPRHANRSDSCHYDPKTKTFIRVGKNFLREGDGNFCEQILVDMCKKRNSEPKPMKGYRFFLFSGTIYQQIDENKVLYKDIGFLDFGGWGSSKLMSHAILKDRKNKFKDSIISSIKEFPENAKISDYKDQYTKKVDGKVVDGFGMLLSNIDFSGEKIE